MTAALSLAPADTGEPEETGLAVERAGREALCRLIKLAPRVNAPNWHQLLFGHSRIDFKIPRPPDAVLEEIARTYTPDNLPMPQTPAETLGGALRDHLSQAKPQGTAPRSITGRPPLPAQRGAMNGWLRRIFLLTAGPDALRLLAAAGYLTAQDIGIMEQFYPKGLDKERSDAVQAAMAVTAASHRTGHDADLPAWLNDQLFTLLGEKRPTDFYSSLFPKPQQPKQSQPSIASAPRTRVVDQLAPSTLPDQR